jgi:uncharacterized membrane protein YqjE
MDHKTTLNGFGTRDASAHILAQNMAGIAHDVITIAELQVQLFSIDLRALRNGVVRGLVIWVIAFTLLFAALPTALIGAGLWLADLAHLSTAVGLLAVALGAFLLVMGLLISGWRQFTRQRAALNRSRKELHNNLAAMRQVLSSYAGRGSGD